MAELTVAVVGCGAQGNVHLACWSNLSGVRIVAVCDTDGITAARTAAQYEGTAAFTGVYDLLVMQPFDIVDVCTPAAAQYEVTAADLQTGANVLCETPFTADTAQARRLAQLASERERLLMPGFCHRFHPPILFASDLLANDDLGRPSMFRCRFSGLRLDLEERGLKQAKGMAEGALFETAIHGVDLFRALCGEAHSATGKTMATNPDLRVEDTVGLVLQSDNALGVVETSWSSPGGRNAVEVYGTAGACLIDYDLGTLRYLTADQPVWRSHDVGGPNRFEREIAHFADAVRGLQPLLISGEDGVRAVELCTEVYRQNRL